MVERSFFASSHHVGVSRLGSREAETVSHHSSKVACSRRHGLSEVKSSIQASVAEWAECSRVLKRARSTLQVLGTSGLGRPRRPRIDRVAGRTGMFSLVGMGVSEVVDALGSD